MKFLIRDPRQSTYKDPHGPYLSKDYYPAHWSPFKDYALAYSREQIDKMAKTWPYLSGCVLEQVV